MKKLILSFLFVIGYISAFAQPASLSQSVYRSRVLDSAAAITANVSQIANGYAPMFFNAQATTPHWDIWNGSSYDHVFDFNAGGGGTPTLQAVLDNDGVAVDADIQVVDGSTGVGIFKNGAEVNLGANSGATGGAFAADATGPKIKIDNSGADPAEGSVFIVGSDGYLDELPIGADGEVLTSDGTTVGWETGAGLTDGNGTTVNGTALDWEGVLTKDVNIAGASSFGINLGRTPVGASSLLAYLSAKFLDTGGLVLETNLSDGIYFGGSTAGTRKLLLRAQQTAVTAPLVLQGYATGSLPTASDHSKGIVYDNTTNTVKFSNGSAWGNIRDGGAAATVTTNANLTGDVTSSGNATTLATVNSNVGTFGSTTQVGTFTVNAKGLITAASNATITPPVPTTSSQTASYTLALADAQNYVKFNSATPVNCTIPPQSSITWVANTTVTIYNYGAGIVTITPGSGVTPRLQTGGSLDIPQYGFAVIKRDGSNDWLVLNGNNAATVLSGTYTPTLSNTTNVAASTPYVTGWYRVGNMVTVFGKFDLDVTLAASTATELGVSLPVASALAAEEDLGGTAISDSVASLSARIKADATNDRASIVMKALSLTNDSYSFEFSYQVK